MIYLYYDKSKNTTASLPFLASLHSAAHNSPAGDSSARRGTVCESTRVAQNAQRESEMFHRHHEAVGRALEGQKQTPGHGRARAATS